MALFAISDLHLSFSADKPMNVFGKRWENHTQRIKENWLKAVSPDDTVVLPGDLSWSDGIESADGDFRFVAALPGKKIIGKGNHDFWWQTSSKLKRYVSSIGVSDIEFLHNNAFETDEFIICGGKGYLPDGENASDDKRLSLREAERLKLSLTEGEKLHSASPQKEILVFLHYPPAYALSVCEPICEVLHAFRVGRVYCGHIHSAELKLPKQAGGASLRLISSDSLNFTPLRILPLQ